MTRADLPGMMIAVELSPAEKEFERVVAAIGCCGEDAVYSTKVQR
jgi:hypothetical protein